MLKQLIFHGKEMDVRLTEQAISQSAKLNSKLIIEIQIYFSCLLGKRLAFYADQPMRGTWQVESDEFSSMLGESQLLNENIYLRFNTVMTKSCSVSDYIGPPPVSDFKIKNQKPYVPSWLKLDYQDGQWLGEYGWPVSNQSASNTKQVRGQAKQVNIG
jgi:hypothetical protein